MKDLSPLSEISSPSAENNSLCGDNEATIISGSAPEDIAVSSAELGERLGIPSDDRMSNYKNLHAIGLGGVGAVYSGNEPGTNREVAIKILRPQYRFSVDRIKSFVREARATAQIDHPNVVPVYRFGVFENEGVYFSMKRVRGETLRNVLRKLAENRRGYSRKYTLRRLVNIFISACNGVAFANRNGIFHGDLKPGNIMIGEFGEVLVMDWGMARYRPEFDTFEGRRKIRLETPEELHFEQTMTANADAPIGGTPVFMAPEHLTGAEKNLTERSEVYALGTILYSILTWRAAPYDTDQPREEIIRQVVRGRFQAPRRIAPKKQPVPRELEAICRKAMNKDPGKRYRNVSIMVNELQNYLDGYPVRAYSPSPFYHMGKWIGRHPLIPVTLTALGLGILGFKAYTMMQDEVEMKSRLRVAEVNAAMAFNYGTAAGNSFRKLKNASALGYQERFRLFRETGKYTALMANSYSMALASLYQLPHAGNDVRSPRLILAREIFRNTVTVYRELGEIQLLQETVMNYRKRWGRLFIKVLENDPELLRLISLTEAERGFLKIELPENSNWQISIKENGGSGYDTSAGTADDLQLSAGDYTVRFSDPQRGEFFFPFRILPGKSVTLSPGSPVKVPSGMCYIGSGEIPVNDPVHSTGGGELPPFMISKYEVSIGEYLEFWRSLPENERSRHTAVTSTGSSGVLTPVWDQNGKLRPPYNIKHPVTGISASSAVAYCRYLGRKLGKEVRLPTLAQWRKAAFCFDVDKNISRSIFYSEKTAERYQAGAHAAEKSPDVSAYGVVNAFGNVREMLEDSSGKTHHVVGGSFMTSGMAVSMRGVQFTVSGENDIGFRYVVKPDMQ